MINKLCIIGVGLIGGSLARALRARAQVHEIVGCGRTVANLREAVDLGVIDYAESAPVKAVSGCDMVVIAIPVGAMSDVLKAIAPAISENMIVTDVGSVKAPVVAAARAALGARVVAFVPGHPIAGTEHSGIRASQAELFRGRRVVLTPEPDTNQEALSQVETMWQTVGAHVVRMAAERHDAVLAASSHLPHVLAYALIDMLVRRDDHQEIFACAAGGFRDFTRIAASDPAMWRDICLANADKLTELLRQYQSGLEELIAALEKRDGSWLFETFLRAKRARDAQFGNDHSNNDGN